MRIRRYSELIRLPTFEERFEYLSLSGRVGQETFGFDRYLNQVFYRSKEWKETRGKILLRDSDGDYPLDLAHEDHPIGGRVIIHHMNPISVDDLENNLELLLDPEFLITVWEITHNAIHYGNIDLLPKPFVERRAGDTCPWK